jgi:hypothetical protein
MADDQEFSMWELGSGLPLDGARVHSTKAIFTYNQEYAANAVVLDITWQPEDESADAQHQLYSVGKNWEPLDSGAKVGATSGKRQKFNDQTNIGRLIAAYIEARGNGDFQTGLKAVISEGMEPDDAQFWIGLDVTLKSVKYPTQSKNPDGTVKEGSTMVVGEYHGRIGEDAPKGKVAAKPAAKAAAKPAAATSDGDDHAEHLGQALYRKLKKLAVDADDHDAFMDAAFALEDATSDDKAWNKATERIILNSDSDSLFAQARA